jgi:quinol monooxygenase YgiN
MIIVAGKIYIKDDHRQEFLEKSKNAIMMARQTPGCIDFSVSPDILENHRVNIYEVWISEEHLDAFRGSGPDDDLSSMILRFEVNQHMVNT